MNKKIFGNLFVLAVFFLILDLIFRFGLLFTIGKIQFGWFNISDIAGLLAAMMLGEIYVLIFRKVMPKMTKINLVVIYLVIGITAWVLVVKPTILMLAILTGVNLVYALVLYWLLGAGCKFMKWALKKRAEKENVVLNKKKKTKRSAG